MVRVKSCVSWSLATDYSALHPVTHRFWSLMQWVRETREYTHFWLLKVFIQKSDHRLWQHMGMGFDKIDMYCPGKGQSRLVMNRVDNDKVSSQRCLARRFIRTRGRDAMYYEKHIWQNTCTRSIAKNHCARRQSQIYSVLSEQVSTWA